MFKMLNPRRFYHAVGKKKFLEFILLAVFILFFYGPLLNMLMLAFANEYNVPSVLPQEWGFKWWGYVFGQKSLVSSMIQSFIIAIATTVISMIFCIPAAYSLARFQYPGRKVFMLSFLLTNAFPKLGIYTSIAVLFYKYGLMGTYAGVIIIHIDNSMMFMVWLPSSAFRNVHPAARGSCEGCWCKSGPYLLQGDTADGDAGNRSCHPVHLPWFHGRGTGNNAGRSCENPDHAGSHVRNRA